MRAALALSAVLLLAACATERGPTAGLLQSPRLSPAQERGRAFAVRRCAGCHTIGQDGGGAQEGPAFRALAFRYNPLALQRRFAEVSEHGFDMMPPVSITRTEAEDLLAYMATLQGP
jgi:mono/diheme cytochrome c family protein